MSEFISFIYQADNTNGDIPPSNMVSGFKISSVHIDTRANKIQICLINNGYTNAVK